MSNLWIQGRYGKYFVCKATTAVAFYLAKFRQGPGLWSLASYGSPGIVQFNMAIPVMDF